MTVLLTVLLAVCLLGMEQVKDGKETVEAGMELSEEEKQCLEKTIYQEEYDIKDMEK